MKVKDFIAQLNQLDPNAEVMVSSGCDTMGTYSYFDPSINENKAIKYTGYGRKTGVPFVAYEATYSNWGPSEPRETNIKEVTVYVIE